MQRIVSPSPPSDRHCSPASYSANADIPRGLLWLHPGSAIVTRQKGSQSAISRDQYDAVLLDPDGVITDTASVHATCWKQMFDEYLQKRAAQRGEAFRPFDIATDYRLYVDGKPRYDGGRDFLRSRGIQLPEGHPDDSLEAETVDGLGNRKRAIAECW